jgi:hypothetical protein
MTKAPAKPESQAEVIEFITWHWNQFVATTDVLTDEQWTALADPAGWAVKDHVSHVTVWDQSIVELIRHHTPQQTTLQVTDAAWTAGGFDAMNEEIRQRKRGLSVSEIQAERSRTWEDVLDVLSGISDRKLGRPGSEIGLGKSDRPLRDVLVENFADHYDDHCQYIARIVESEH